MTDMRRLFRYEHGLQPLPTRPLLLIGVGVQVLTFVFALSTGFSPLAYAIGAFAEGFLLGPTVAFFAVYLLGREWSAGGLGMWLSLPGAGTTKLVVRIARVSADTAAAWLPSAAVYALDYLAGHVARPHAVPLSPTLIGHAAWILVGAAAYTPVVAAFFLAICFWSQRLARVGGWKGVTAFVVSYMAVYAGLFAMFYNVFGTRPQEPWRSQVAPGFYVPIFPTVFLYALFALWVVWSGRWIEEGAEVRSQGMGWK